LSFVSIIPIWLLFLFPSINNFEYPEKDINTLDHHVILQDAIASDSTSTNDLIELSKMIAQLEVEIEQLRNKIKNNPDNNLALQKDIESKSGQLKGLNDQIKGFEGTEAQVLSNEIISLQEVLNLESSIIQKQVEIRKLETNLDYSNTPNEIVNLILEIENLKTEQANSEKHHSNNVDGVKEDAGENAESLNHKVQALQSKLDSAQTPDRITEMVLLLEDKKAELRQMQKGFSAIKDQQAGGMGWEKANAYRIQNLLMYIHGVEEEIEDIRSSIANSSESEKPQLEKKLSMKKIELKELLADLDLAGGKYAKPDLDPTETSKELDLQSKIEKLKQEILSLKSDLNGFDISKEEQERILQLNANLEPIDHINESQSTTPVQELVILIDNKEKELAKLEKMLNASGDSKEVSWEGKLKYEDHTISSINKYILEVEKAIQEQNNIINGNYSSTRKATARSAITGKNNELQNLIAELELAGGTYTPGQFMVDMAAVSDATDIIEKEPEPLFEKKKPKKDFKKGTKFLLKNVLFAFDKSIIQESSYEELGQLVALLNEEPKKRVELSGHTDDWGPAAYNQYLSEKRAKAVANYLSKKGIDKKRMVVKGYGETQPIAPNLLPNGSDNFEGRKKNRRTEIKVID